MSTVDRRTFLGSLSITGAVLFAGWPALSSAAQLPHPQPLPVGGTAGLHDVDDMWGHWPRYAHPIPYRGSQAAPLPWESLDPVDQQWAAWV